MPFSNRFAALIYGLMVPVLGLAWGCQGSSDEASHEMADADMPAYVDTIRLDNRADSVAMKAYQAVGGPAVWEMTPFIQFNYAVLRDVETRTVYRHAWNRATGDYRLEMQGPAQLPYVVLMNVNTNEGAVYYDGFPLDSVATLAQLPLAYRRYKNDTFWLLMPFKLFDEGVHREYVADSSDAENDVLHVTFGDQGITQGDQYWVYVNKETGLVRQWAYVLGDEPTVAPRFFIWDEYESYDGPAGTLHFATRKRSVGVPYAIQTAPILVPAEMPADFFTDPRPRLTPPKDS